MKFFALVFAFVLLGSSTLRAAQAHPANEFRQLTKVEPLPVALDKDFVFRKTKLLLLGSAPGQRRATNLSAGAPKDPAVGFEGTYRLFGALTALDQGRRFGNYFDFFWRALRPADITVRLEYRQEKLRSFTQAREVSYSNVKGSRRTSFAVIGDDFHTDGRVLSWRCLLIERGRVVAEERSYLWR